MAGKPPDSQQGGAVWSRRDDATPCSATARFFIRFPCVLCHIPLTAGYVTMHCHGEGVRKMSIDSQINVTKTWPAACRLLGLCGRLWRLVG
jgi:hypothetical protein